MGRSTVLQRLSVDARKCTLCADHLDAGPRPVFTADRRARLLIAGQAPGRKVHKSGVPFDDASGERLREWLGITSEQFYDASKVAILPMGFCYPGRGRSGDLPPRPECAERWRQPFLQALPNIQLTLVIGQYALAYHLPEAKGQTLTQTVKNWREFWPERLPLPHPSPRNNIWLAKNTWFEDDVLPALRELVGNLL